MNSAPPTYSTMPCRKAGKGPSRNMVCVYPRGLRFQRPRTGEGRQLVRLLAQRPFTSSARRTPVQALAVALKPGYGRVWFGAHRRRFHELRQVRILAHDVSFDVSRLPSITAVRVGMMTRS